MIAAADCGQRSLDRHEVVALVWKVERRFELAIEIEQRRADCAIAR